MNKIILTLLCFIFTGIYSSSFAQVAQNLAVKCKRDIETNYKISLIEKKLKYAKEFAVLGNMENKDFKIVTVKTPWHGGKKSYTYLLHKKKDIPPNLCRNIPRIRIPSKRLVAFSTTHLPPLTMLKKHHTLKAFSGNKYVSSETINKMIKDGKIKNVGHPPNPEVIISIRPDLVMAYATMSPKVEGIEKLIRLGLPVVFNADYKEKNPLARAEWIKFMALFYNEEEKASKLFQKIESRYLNLKLKVMVISNLPTVLVGQNSSGIWHAPGWDSDLAEYIMDAGGIYLWPSNKSHGMMTLNFETVFSGSKSAKIWLPQNNEWNKLSDILNTDPRYAKFPVFKSGKVYNFNAKISKHGGNDYFETGMMRPDLLLSDLIKIFHPSVLPDHKLIWYKLLK